MPEGHVIFSVTTNNSGEWWAGLKEFLSMIIYVKYCDNVHMMGRGLR
jgi:hypothetical protein